MLKTILKRILLSIPRLLIVITITFVLTRMIPGNPARTILGPQASAQDIAEMEIKLGLNKSKLEQYADYMIGILHGDFGTSYVYNRPVTSLIAERIPNTLVITLTSLVIAIFIGVGIGVLSAIKQYSILDYIFMILALVGVSMPIFWLGLMLVNLFSVQLGWLPALGMGSMSKGIGDVISHMVLPCFCLATIPTATFARITRSSMLEVIHSDSIKALRARGIKESSIIWKHALKNALLPVITAMGMNFGASLGGAVIIETVFGVPGLGMLIVNSIRQKDTPTVMAATLFLAVLFCLVMLVVDILYAYIDPRIKAKYQK